MATTSGTACLFQVVHMMPRFLLIGLLRPQMGHRAGCHLNAPRDAFNLRVLNEQIGRPSGAWIPGIVCRSGRPPTGFGRLIPQAGLTVSILSGVPYGQPGKKIALYTWAFNTWFLGRPEIVDFWGQGGPGGPKNHSKRWGGEAPQVSHVRCIVVVRWLRGP